MLFYIFYVLLWTMIPCAIFQMFMSSYQKKRGKVISAKHIIWVYIFVLYITLVYSVTGIPSISEIAGYKFVSLANEINIQPFASGGLFTYITNIIMFMPFGFLLPLIWKPYSSLRKITITALVFSFAIELSQLFNNRLSDIDDLIMNTLGAIIGYIIFYVFNKYILKNGNVSEEESRDVIKTNFLVRFEAILYLICSAIGVLFMYTPY